MITDRRVFILLTALLCLPVWLVTWFPSQDGPSHLYNAGVLLSLLTNSHSIYHEWYTLTPGLSTNLTAHVLLALLSTLFSPSVSQKIVVTLCIVLPAAGLRYAAGAIRPRGASLAALALPAVSGVFLHMGFYSFLLGVALLCFACGYWFRRWGAFSAKEVLWFAVLLTALFVSHILPWAVAILAIGVPALWVSVTRGGLVRYLLPTCLAVLPGAMLSLAHVAHARRSLEAGPLFPVRSALDLLSENPVVSLAQTEVFVFVALAFVTLVLTAFTVRAKLVRPRWSPYDWLAPLSAFLFLLFMAAPSRAMGGSYLRPRLWLLSGITLLLWMASHPFVARDRMLLSAVAAVLTAAMAWSHWNSYRAIDPFLREMAAVSRIVPENRSVLNLRYSQSMPRANGRPLCLRIDCFLHAGAYVSRAPGDVWVNNYEASTGHFPVSWRAGLDIRTAGSFDAEPPCVDLLSWQAKTARSIDYVMLTGYPLEERLSGCAGVTQRQLQQSYDLIYRSGSRFVQVYRRRQN